MESTTYRCNDYVAAVYDGAWCPGMIIQEEEWDGAQVNFMARASTKIKGRKWPERKDQLFIPKSSVQYFAACAYWEDERGLQFV